MYSRRTILKWLGVGLASASLRPAFAFLPDVPQIGEQGRALTALPVYRSRHINAPIVTRLWPDSIVSLRESDRDWCQVDGGYVQREQVQPMTSYLQDECCFRPDYPFWAEVAGPVASVRAFCAANAPLVTRIGHGGVMRVVDGLPGEPCGWYGISDASGAFLGWTQATHWRAVSVEMELRSPDERLVVMDHRATTLTAYEADKAILQATYAAGSELGAGTYFAERLSVGGGRWDGDVVYHGLPWQMRLGDDQFITGAYWHNRFGQSVPGPAVQLPPVLARWLYTWLEPQSQLVVK
jgi:hypothetical protein